MRMRWFVLIGLMSCTTLLGEDSPKVYAIEGQVTDHKGKPIKGAAVEWGRFDYQRESREVFRTDDEGRYRVETTQAGIDYRVGVSSTGFAPQWRDGVSLVPIDQEATKIDFKLSRPLTLRGRVIDKAGKPIKGITVAASHPTTGFFSSFSSPSPGFPFPGPERAGMTDGNGYFVIRNLPATAMMPRDAEKGHPYDLKLYVPGGRSSTSRAGYLKQENVLSVTRSDFLTGDDAIGEIRGKVIDFQSQQPIKKFYIVIRHRPESKSFVDDAGEFCLQEKLDFGRRYQVFVYADGYAPCIQNAIAIGPADKVMPMFTLTRSTSLKGTITDSDGKPIKGAKILYGVGPADPTSPNNGGWTSMNRLVDGYLGWKTVQRMTTTSDGSFWFSLSPPSEEAESVANVNNRKRPLTPRMMVKAPGYARKYVSPDDLQPKLRDGNVTVELSRESTITIVAQNNGQFDPAVGISVSHFSRYYRSLEAPYFEDERHRAVGLVPGKYKIAASFELPSCTVRLERMVELADGEEAKVKLHFQSGDYTLSGKARAFSGISARPEIQAAGSDLVSISTTTDADGTYLIPGLPAGSYQVSSVQASSRRNGFIGKRARDSASVQVNGDVTHNFHVH